MLALKQNPALRQAVVTCLVAGAAALALAGLARAQVAGLGALAELPLWLLLAIALVPCALAPLARLWADRLAGVPGAKPQKELARSVETMRQRLEQTTVSRDYLHKVLNSMADAVFVTDPAGRIRTSNEAACKLSGYGMRGLFERDIGALLDNPTGQPVAQLLQKARETGEATLRMRSGETVPVSFSGSDLSADDPGLAGSIFVLRDITDRKRAERRIRYLARFDALTKIPNRMQFQHLLQQAVARSLRGGHAVALLYLDMDHFKEINDTFGHAAGDRVLEALTERVSKALPPGAVFGRLAGDEFAVFIDSLPRTTAAAGVKQVAGAILQSVSDPPVHVGNQEIFLAVSAGAAICPDDADNVIDLFRNADAAMYRSKQNGGNSCVFYERAMNADANERVVLKSKLKRAVQRDELVVRYLPKIDLRSGLIVGAEALLRWRAPGHGEIPPSLFIALAEENELINQVGEWVMNRVCLEYHTLCDRVRTPGRIALNLSLKQLRQASFILNCRSVFERHKVSPDNFELEITETTLMADPKRIVEQLRELRAMGLHLSIDDFGTGYSSLSALRQFPIGSLKIDQSFVRDSDGDSDKATLVRTIIEMGRTLGMDVVAEGVETPQALAMLRKLGCHYAQGRLFGEPCTAEGLASLLVEQELGAPPFAPLFDGP